MQEAIKVKGQLTLTVLDIDGNVVQQIDQDNLVVTSGKKILARLLGHDGAYTGEFVDTIAFGTDATAAVVGQTSLLAQTFSKAVAVTYPADNSVMFSATMLANEGGSSTYREYGLLSAGTDMLFSRIVLDPVVKSTAYQIKADWTISFQ